MPPKKPLQKFPLSIKSIILLKILEYQFLNFLIPWEEDEEHNSFWGEPAISSRISPSKQFSLILL